VIFLKTVSELGRDPLDHIKPIGSHPIGAHSH